jgi:hypothetical protein
MFVTNIICFKWVNLHFHNFVNNGKNETPCYILFSYRLYNDVTSHFRQVFDQSFNLI